MAKQQNITKVYEKIFTIKEMLTEAVNTAMEVANDAEGFGGEVSRVITSQLRQDFIPVIQKYIDDHETHSSMSSLIGFLDSVPLAWIRTGPQEDPHVATAGAETFPGTPATQQQAAPMLPGQVTPNAGVAPAPQQRESAILKGNSRLRESLRKEWEDSQRAITPQAELDFKALMEGYKTETVPGQYTGITEDQDRMFDMLVNNETKKQVTREKLNEDIIAGPYKVHEDVGEMGDWRKLTSYDDPFDILTMEGKDIGIENKDETDDVADPNVVDEIASDMFKAHDL